MRGIPSVFYIIVVTPGQSLQSDNLATTLRHGVVARLGRGGNNHRRDRWHRAELSDYTRSFPGPALTSAGARLW